MVSEIQGEWEAAVDKRREEKYHKTSPSEEPGASTLAMQNLNKEAPRQFGRNMRSVVENKEGTQARQRVKTQLDLGTMMEEQH